MDLQGKVALITGGGRGVGAATATLLAARGAQVVINYIRNTEAANSVVTAIREASGEASAMQADMCDEQQVAQLVANVIQLYGRIDILVSNVAIHSIPKPFEQISWDEFSQRIKGELQAAFYVTQAILPIMIRQNYGRLVYVGSEHARGPVLPGTIAHGTAKAALLTFVQYLACEVGPRGITANVVSPGMVESESLASFLPAPFRQQIAAATPLRRTARPDDVARVIAFLAGDDSSFMTGTCVPVTGGFGLARASFASSLKDWSPGAKKEGLRPLT